MQMLSSAFFSYLLLWTETSGYTLIRVFFVIYNILKWQHLLPKQFTVIQGHCFVFVKFVKFVLKLILKPFFFQCRQINQIQ